MATDEHSHKWTGNGSLVTVTVMLRVTASAPVPAVSVYDSGDTWGLSAANSRRSQRRSLGIEETSVRVAEVVHLQRRAFARKDY